MPFTQAPGRQERQNPEQVGLFHDVDVDLDADVVAVVFLDARGRVVHGHDSGYVCVQDHVHDWLR